MPFSSIEEAAADIRDGRMVIIVDDEDRENEGDLVCAAEKVTPEIINFMATHARGLICMPLTEERCDELHLTMQVADNTSFLGTAFTISIEARRGVTTGISAADRATTILTPWTRRPNRRIWRAPATSFPLRARQGGVLVRPGQTEASVDMARIAGLYPAGVICEIMNPDGTMARLPELREFARTHDLKIISVADLVRYRMQKETLVRRAAEAEIKTVYGRFPRRRLRERDQFGSASGDGDGRRADGGDGAGACPHGEHHGRRVRLAHGRYEFPVAHGV
jgi:3,4-dihydroxy 2-butanone 4-phosphate synthase/GTP cyclohydrolase II